MAFNNGFPVTYGQMYPQVMQPPQPPAQNSNLVWVQGEAGAKSYLVAPNNTIPLWDSEAQVIFLKSADASGMPSMKVLDYTIRESANLPQKGPINEKVDEYVTKKELDSFKAEISKQIEAVKESMGV